LTRRPSPTRRPRPSALIPPRRRPPALLLSGGVLQLVCRADDASACQPLSAAAGRRACARWPAGPRGVLPC
jgi:hypothetical protein